MMSVQEILMSFMCKMNRFFVESSQLPQAKTMKHKNCTFIDACEENAILEASEDTLVPNTYFALDGDTFCRVNPSMKLLRSLCTVLDPHFHRFTFKIEIRQHDAKVSE